MPVSLVLASRGSVLGKTVLGLGFFCVLGLKPCVLDSTSGTHSNYCEVIGMFENIFVTKCKDNKRFEK